MLSTKKLFRTISFFALITLSGCATQYQAYDGQKQPTESIAVVKGVSSAFITLKFASVDGKQLGSEKETYKYADTIEVLPGKHTVGIWYLSKWLGRYATGQVTFDSQAGKVYQVAGEDDGNALHAPTRVKFSVTEEAAKP